MTQASLSNPPSSATGLSEPRGEPIENGAVGRKNRKKRYTEVIAALLAILVIPVAVIWAIVLAVIGIAVWLA